MLSKSFSTIALGVQTLLVWICAAEKYTAPIDYGFGPLTITIEGAEGDMVTRCQEVDISLDGGFGPYKLASVNALNKSMPIKLKTNRTALWEAAVSEGSQVAFNITDRAGATHQTPLLEVLAAEDGMTCENSTLYMNVPEEDETFVSGSARSMAIVHDSAVLPALFGIISVSAVVTVVV